MPLNPDVLRDLGIQSDDEPMVNPFPTARKRNPEQVAQGARVAKATGVDAILAADKLPEFQDELDQGYWDNLVKNSPETAKFLSANEQNAALAHQDTDNLVALEANLKPKAKPLVTNAEFTKLYDDMRRRNPSLDHDTAWRMAREQVAGIDNRPGGVSESRGPAAAFASVVGGLASSFKEGAESARQGIRMQFADLFGFDNVTQDAKRQYGQSQFRGQLATPEFESATARGIYGGGASTVRQLPGIVASILTRSTAPMLASAGLQTESEAYAKYRARGATGGEAFAGGVGEGAVEVLTEKIPMGFFVNRFGKTGASEFLSGLIAREVPSEQVATLVQDAIDTAVANPNKTWDEYLQERPGAAYQTLLATLVQSGIMGGANTAVGKLTGQIQQDQQRAQEAQQSAESLQGLLNTAAQSKLRTLSPDTFASFAQQAAERSGEAPTELYVDARAFSEALNQEGVDSLQVLASMPTVAQQLDEAIAAGGDIVLPMGEALAALPGSAIEQAVVPHLRTGADALSLAEAQETGNQSAEFFQQAAQDVLAEQAENAAFQQSAQAVYDNVLGQLQTANRFTADVNESYAALMRDFYVTTANRLGVTPEQMLQQYPVKIGAELPTGEKLDQSPVESDAFKNWFGGSRVVDEKGAPLRVFHGTKADFSTFDIRKAGASDDGLAGKGFYFTYNPEEASGYAESDIYGAGDAPNVQPVYVAVKNPLKIVKGVLPDGRKVMDIHKQFGPGINAKGGAAIRKIAEDGGHDGVMWVRTDGGVGHVVAFNPEQIKSAIGNDGTFDANDPSILSQNTGANRGAFNPETLTITLLKSADLTTFLHESAHFFLTVYEDIAAQPNAPAAIADDMDTLLSWMGVEATPEESRIAVWSARTLEQKRAGHERFAESFEEWMFGGNAPSLEMQGLFQRFRSWVLRAYRSLKEFQRTHQFAALNPEIEQVFSRMLASEEQMQAAEQFRSMRPIFKTAEEAGMTPEEYAAYQQTGKDSTDTAASEFERRSLRDMRWLSNAKAKALKRLQKEAKGLRDEIRAEVTPQVYAEPIYQVWQFLTGKGLEDGTAGRFNKQAMLDIFTEYSPVYQILKDRRMIAKDGMHPDMIAEMFGFTSGDELALKLAESETPAQVIEAMIDQRMLERHGELSTPEDLERAAEAAIHNEARAKFVATELAALRGELGNERQLRKAAKDYAAQMIARLKVRDVKPGRYAAAEAKAARAAERAMRKGDREQAITEKRNQLLNNAAARAALDAIDETNSSIDYLRAFDKDAKRRKLDKDYLDQIDALLEKFDLRRSVSNKDAERSASLRTWVQSRLKAGEVPDIAETLLSKEELAVYLAQVESRDEDGDLVYADDEERIKLLADAIDRSAKRSYKELTVEELRGLVDTVRNIEHLGKLKHTLLTAKDQANYEAARDEIAAGIAAQARRSGKNKRTANDVLGKKLQALKQFGASHIKVATWARIMDGGKDNGPVWRFLVKPANERATMETTMRAEATAKLDEILRPILAKVGAMDKMGKGKYFPDIGESLNWQERFAIALNAGNESNLQRLLGGKGWAMPQIMPVLNSLTAEEWQAVQAVWDQFESYRPQIAAKELRVVGKEPTWIEPRALTVRTADGQTITLRGGYYPVIYDPRTNLKAQQHSAAEEAKNAMKAAYSAATTRRSFTKERVEEVHGRELLLNLQGVYSGINDVIHDLAWHEWVIDANKLLRSKTIDEAIREHYGPEVKKEFEKWRDDIVAGTRRLDHAIEQAAGWVRQGVSAAGLSFNLMSAAMQPLGLTQSIVRVGATWIGKGVAKYVAAPIETAREVNEKSEWMRNRSRTRFRELNELRNQVQGQTAPKELMGRYGYFFMMKMQQTVDVPTWWGAYEKAIAGGFNEDTAVSLADQAVKDSQGGGEEVDQSGVERGGPLVKLFTVFYSFMNTAANLGYAQARTEKSKARLAVQMLLLYSVPAVLGSFLKDALTPGDAGDEDELGKKLLTEQISYLMGLIAFGREFGQAFKALVGEDKGMGYSGPAGLRMIPDSVKLAQQSYQGEFDDSFRKAFINLAGDMFGLPSAQINRTITGAQAIQEGETANPAALAFGYQKHR